MSNTSNPSQAPRQSSEEIIENALNTQSQTPLEDLKKAIKNHSINELDNLALLINDQLQDAPDALQNFKSAIQERVEALTQTMEINKKIEELEKRINLIELLPDLTLLKSPLQRITNFAVNKMQWIAHSTTGATGAAGMWIGKTADTAYTWISNPNNREWLKRTIKNLAMRRFYNALSTPSMLGIPSGIPGIDKIGEFGKEKLAEMDALDTIWKIIAAEREMPPQNNIEFDGKLNKATWLRLSAEDRMPEKIKEMTQYFITKQREGGLGTPDSPIVVKMELLMNPTQADELAAAAQEEQAETARTDLVETLQNKWSTESVTFGNATEATRSNNTWVITVKEEDIDIATEDAKTNTEASQLISAINTLENVATITIGGTETKMQKDATGIAVQLPDATTTNLANINLLAKNLQGREGYIASVDVVRDVTLNNRIAWSPVGGVGNVQCTDSMIETVNAHFTKLIETIETNTPMAQTFFEWKNGTWKIATPSV